MSNVKQSFKQIIKYSVITIAFYLLNVAGLNGKVYPFTFGLFFALVWCNNNVFLTSISYLISGALAVFDINGFYGYIFTAIFTICVYLIHFKFKKPVKVFLLCVYALISQIVSVYIKICAGASIYLTCAELIYAVLFMAAMLKLFEGFYVKGFCRLSTNETIFYCIFVSAISCGLCSLKIFDFEVVKLVGIFAILLISFVTDFKMSVLTSLSFATGALLYDNNPMYFVMFLIFGMAVLTFKNSNKYILGISVLVSEAVLGLYFQIYYTFTYIGASSTCVAVLAFFCLPNSLLSKIKNYYISSLNAITVQSIINRNREELSTRLLGLSDVFLEMNKSFKQLINGGLTQEEVSSLALMEIKNKICVNCPEKNKCYRALNAETYNALNHLILTAIQRGKVTLLDFPQYFTENCARLNSLVGLLNDLMQQFKNYSGIVENVDASKMLVAEQLLGVSNIMKDLSLETSAQIDFDEGREKRIVEELAYLNINAQDALVYKNSKGKMNVCLAVKKEDSLKLKIVDVVSKVCCQKMIVQEQASGKKAGFDVLTFKSAPKFQVVFGACQKTKTGSTKSGDNFSITKILDDKFLFALCDGMGSGNKAEKASTLALNLIENFYKAGFENEIVLSSINKILAIGKEEIFSALDLTVIDARNGTIDFIKMGAPESFVKHKNTTEKIETGALPLGILQNVEPKFSCLMLENQDIVVLCTDGVVDAFNGRVDLLDYINNINSKSPQQIAEQIIGKAYDISGGIYNDDMTVIVARIME